jgi:hypothetical protein
VEGEAGGCQAVRLVTLEVHCEFVGVELASFDWLACLASPFLLQAFPLLQVLVHINEYFNLYLLMKKNLRGTIDMFEFDRNLLGSFMAGTIFGLTQFATLFLLKRAWSKH